MQKKMEELLAVLIDDLYRCCAQKWREVHPVFRLADFGAEHM
jgi:hypothetical protein